ncbi:MAG TPA: glycosyl hydrolase 115 family protein, partial [Fimbriimonadaceae bacterium]|nr:glycosyl hydrolase 115 family protein [Fimbriimonadaceae bacterium]
MLLARVLGFLLCFAFTAEAFGLGTRAYVIFAPKKGAFPLVGESGPAPIYVAAGDWPGVIRAAGDLRDDVRRVTGSAPQIEREPKGRRVVVIGTVGRSSLIGGLIKSGKIDVSPIEGKWEATLTQVVEHPWPGVEQALVIAGSDKRGTIYGIYAISEQAGVSPWYWWADVPVKRHKSLYVMSGRHIQGPPAVKYRGIFLNDEAPSLSNWVYQNFGEYKHTFYVHVFELLLRLRANYLWPAMWYNCFSEDDPLNP